MKNLITVILLLSVSILWSQPNANFNATGTTGCAPLAITFNNTSTNSSSYYWDFGNGQSSTLVNPTVLYQTPGTYNVKLIAYHQSQADSIVQMNFITVHPGITPSFTFNQSGNCEGATSVSFINTTSGATSYSWNFGDGNVSNAQHPTHVYGGAGSFYPSLTVQNSFGCQGSFQSSQPIVVDPLPQPSFNLGTISTCDSTLPINFNNTSIGATHYQWRFGNGNTSAASNPTHVYNQSGSFNVELVATSAAGCKDSTTIPQAVNIIQPAAANVQLNNGTGCPPLSTTFALGNTSITNIQWWYGNGASGTTPGHTYNTSGVYTPIVQFTDNNGCVVKDSSFGNVVVHQVPIPAFSMSTDSICLRDIVHFTNLSTNATSYYWRFGDGGANQQISTSHQYNGVPQNFVVSLDAFSAAGCNAKVYDTVYCFSSKVSFISDKTTGCGPLTIHFQNTTPGTTNCLWMFGDGSTSNALNPVHTYSQVGNYSVCLVTTNQMGCTDTLCMNNYIQVVNPIANWNNTTTITACAPYQIALSCASFGYHTWSWNMGDGTIYTGQTLQHNYQTPGNYTVILSTYTQDSCLIQVPWAQVTINGSTVGFTKQINGCTPLNVQFTDTSSNATSWFWEFGDGATSTLQHPSHAYGSLGTYTVKLTITTPNGCTYSRTEINSISPTMCPLNAPPGSNGAGNGGPKGKSILAKGCAPYNIGFTNPFATTKSCIWSFGDGTSSTILNPAHTFNTNGLFTVSMINTDSNNVVDTVIYSNAILVGDAQPNFAVTYPVKCSKDSILLQDQSTTTALLFDWRFDSGDSAVVQHPSHVIPPTTGPYKVTLTIADSMGCTGTTSQILINWPLSFNVNVPDSLCASDTLTINHNIPTGYSIVWHYGDGTQGSTNKHLYANPGQYPLSATVADSAGCTVQLAFDTITVWSPPVGMYLPGGNHYCLGDRIKFKALFPGSGLHVWSLSQHGKRTSVDSVYFTPNKTGTFTIWFDNYDKGCWAQKTYANVLHIHKPQAGIKVAAIAPCTPISVAFQDSSVNANGRTWKFSNGNLFNGMNPIQQFNSFPATINLTVTDSFGCVDSTQLVITQPATPGISATSYSSCLPTPIQFHSVGIDTTVTNIQWVFGDGTTSTSANPSHMYSTAGVFQVKAILNTQGHCIDTLTLVQHIRIGNPKAGFSFTSPGGCAPVNVVITDSARNATSWNYRFGNGGSSTIQNPNIQYFQPGTYWITQIVSDSIGCMDSITGSLPVIVDGPKALFTASDTSICAGAGIQFTDASLRAKTWSWYFGNGQTSPVQNPGITFNNPGVYSAALMVTDSNGCTSLFNLPSSIHVIASPTVNAQLTGTSGCLPLVTAFKASYVADSILWNFGNGLISRSDSGSVTYTQPGSYAVTLKGWNNLGCADSTVYKYVVVESKPSASFQVDTNRNCYGSAFQFQASGGKQLQYLWSINGTPVDTGTRVSLKPGPGQHSIQLIVTNGSGCADTITKANLITVHDSIAPTTPIIKRATVENDSSTLLEWEAVTNNRVKEILVYRAINAGAYQLIATLPSNAVHFRDQAINTLKDVHGYKLVLMDSCEQQSFESNPHVVMNVSAQATPMAVNVSWTPYKGDNVTSYSVLRKSSYDSVYAVVGKVSSASTSFTDSSGYCAGFYTYMVHANGLYGKTLRSYSDTTTVFHNGVTAALQQSEIIRTTVLNDSVVYTEWKNPYTPYNASLQYVLYRSVNGKNPEIVGSFPSHVMNYLDVHTQVDSIQYTYHITTISPCGVESKSNPGSSIVLKSIKHQDKEVHFQWNSYNKWDSGVDHYELQELKSNGEWETINSTKGEETEIIIPYSPF